MTPLILTYHNMCLDHKIDIERAISTETEKNIYCTGQCRMAQDWLE